MNLLFGTEDSANRIDMESILSSCSKCKLLIDSWTVCHVPNMRSIACRILLNIEKRRLTPRAPDVWESARFRSIFLASGFSCSQALSTPAHTQVTQTVGQPRSDYDDGKVFMVNYHQELPSDNGLIVGIHCSFNLSEIASGFYSGYSAAHILCNVTVFS